VKIKIKQPKQRGGKKYFLYKFFPDHS